MAGTFSRATNPVWVYMGIRAANLWRRVTIVNELGLHARSAGKTAAIAREAVSGVWIEAQGEVADARSIMDVLSLGCAKGTVVTIKIDDPADIEILTAIEDLVKGGFEE